MRETNPPKKNGVPKRQTHRKEDRSMSQVVHTLCLRTQDAVSRSDEKGEMQFEVQAGTKFDAVKWKLLKT